LPKEALTMKRKQRLALLLLPLIVLALLWWNLRPPVAAQGERLVMKSGELGVMVMEGSVETAVSRALTAVNNRNGYVLSQRAWLAEDGFTYATLTVGAPVGEFEALLADFKRLGLVQWESVSGQDVTDRSVDLGARLANLETNQDRTRGFLEQTTSITETLHVYQSLRRLEDEAGTLQGQQNYLTNRAAAGTITLNLLPFVPTPTPTPTATPTPLPTPDSWQPGDTAGTAVVLLQNNAQSTADFLIYYSIVCGPWLFLLALIGLPVGRWFWRRRG
jgi:hypothetical protein